MGVPFYKAFNAHCSLSISLSKSSILAHSGEGFKIDLGSGFTTNQPCYVTFNFSFSYFAFPAFSFATAEIVTDYDVKVLAFDPEEYHVEVVNPLYHVLDDLERSSRCL